MYPFLLLLFFLFLLEQRRIAVACFGMRYHIALCFFFFFQMPGTFVSDPLAAARAAAAVASASIAGGAVPSAVSVSLSACRVRGGSIVASLPLERER